LKENRFRILKNLSLAQGMWAMKVVSITPIHVTDKELARRQERYQRLAPAGVTVDLRNLSHQSPVELDNKNDVRSSDSNLASDISEINADSYDVLLPDCILDPGFRKNASETTVGMLDSVMKHLVDARNKIGAVTRNDSIGEELVRRVGEYGYADNFVGLEVLNLSFDAINDEEEWHRALKIAVDRLAEKGATVVINGCSAVNVDQSQLRLPVVDPAELVLQLISEKTAKAH
jgi:Asp/Glu/hydantoin racemase